MNQANKEKIDWAETIHIPLLRKDVNFLIYQIQSI
jgi:hypothetical protein